MINNKNNNVINFNTNKPFQFERRDINNPNINFNINNDYKTKQHKPSYNSVNFNHISDENFSRLNHSSNFITSNNVKNNIWNIPNQFFYQNDISPNNSFVKGSFSDNEIYDNNNNNNNQFLNFNQRKNNYGSFSSHFSHSSSDLLNESYKNEKDYENILSNPDDSIDVNENEDSKNNINSKYILNGLNYGKNDHYFMEKIEETDNFLKELIKEGDLKVENKEFIKKKIFDNKINLNKDNFLKFLKNKKLNYLSNLIESNKISLNELVKYSDSKIIKLIEPENMDKVDILINVLMKYDEKIEGDDVMECLNNLDFRHEKL